jgi:hypothetical protein
VNWRSGVERIHFALFSSLFFLLLFYFCSVVVARGFSFSVSVQVDGVLWDMTRPLEGDCKLQIHKFDSDKGRDTFWHSSAHILGQVRHSSVWFDIEMVIFE